MSSRRGAARGSPPPAPASRERLERSMRRNGTALATNSSRGPGQPLLGLGAVSGAPAVHPRDSDLFPSHRQAFMQPRLLILPAALLLAASAAAQTNPLFISDNVMTGLTWHAAKTPGDGSSDSCALTAGLVNYYSAPFFTDQTADTYSLHIQYPSYQA